MINFRSMWVPVDSYWIWAVSVWVPEKWVANLSRTWHEHWRSVHHRDLLLHIVWDKPLALRPTGPTTYFPPRPKFESHQENTPPLHCLTRECLKCQNHLIQDVINRQPPAHIGIWNSCYRRKFERWILLIYIIETMKNIWKFHLEAVWLTCWAEEVTGVAQRDGCLMK